VCVIILSTKYADSQEFVHYVKYCSIECHYAGYHYAESRSTEWHYEAHFMFIVVIKSIKLSVTVLRVIILSVIILSVVAQNVTSSFFPKGRSLPMPYTMKLFTDVILAISQ
jgi:hypothetical protein